MMTDPIADMLTRVRNANRTEAPAVDMPSTNMKTHIAQVLKDEGFITDFQIGKMVANEEGRKAFQAPVDEKDPKKVLRVFLKYGPDGEKVIRHIERRSRPGAIQKPQGAAPGIGRPRYFHRQHQPWHYERPPGPRPAFGRRVAVHRLVGLKEIRHVAYRETTRRYSGRGQNPSRRRQGSRGRA